MSTHETRKVRLPETEDEQPAAKVRKLRDPVHTVAAAQAEAPPEIPAIPVKVQQVMYRGSPEFLEHAYQYATTSHVPGSMLPAAIVKPGNVDDIKAVVKYAKDNNLAIAVRTGGHQYSGASSTSGKNIQLDLSTTFQEFEYDEAKRLVRVGVSMSLEVFTEKMATLGMFLPYGACAHVHIGGHVQTGGYGLYTRPFGLFCDYVEQLEIVTADSALRVVRRPKPDQPDADNDDLYWAVLGGSPGNFGVLTHVTLRPLYDKDYPNARGMKLVSLYSKEKLQKLVDILAEMNDDEKCPRDFCFIILSLAGDVKSFKLKHAIDHVFGVEDRLTLDQKMMLDYPHLYSGVPLAELGKSTTPVVAPPLIAVSVSWANTGGADQPFTDHEAAWFDRIHKAMEPNCVDDIMQIKLTVERVLKFVHALMGKAAQDYDYLDYTKPTQLSLQIQYFLFPDVREYVMPYEKRLFVTAHKDLSTNGWGQFTVDSFDSALKDKAVKAVLQLGVIGGPESMLGRNDVQHLTSHSWRDTMTMMLGIDCFYEADEKGDNAKQAQTWVNQYQRGGPLASEKDMRLLAFSFGRSDDPEGGAVLDSVWANYYDSEEKYQKLLALKKHFDPNQVFTPNAFCIGGSTAPQVQSL